MITRERAEKFKKVIANRQFDLGVILENVHDPHNIGAVLRSCESVGIQDVYVLLTEDISSDRYVGKASASGAKKWVDIHLFYDVDSCFKEVRKKYERIYGTHLSKDAHSLYELNLVASVCLLFGNEHDGVSEASLNQLDGNFIIPQVGLVQSLNISVACAVSLYEAFRQREKAGKYYRPFDATNPLHIAQYEAYIHKHRKISDK